MTCKDQYLGSFTGSAGMMKNRTTMRRVGVAEEMDIVDPERINVVNSSSVIRQAKRAVYVILTVLIGPLDFIDHTHRTPLSNSIYLNSNRK